MIPLTKQPQTTTNKTVYIYKAPTPQTNKTASSTSAASRAWPGRSTPCRRWGRTYWRAASTPPSSTPPPPTCTCARASGRPVVVTFLARVCDWLAGATDCRPSVSSTPLACITQFSSPTPSNQPPHTTQKQTKRYRDLAAAREGLRALGEEISQGEGLPPEVGPVVFAFTGRGKVAQGT